MPDDIKTLFAHSSTPAPSADLTDRILAAAATQAPLKAANDRKPWLWSAAAGIAATIMAGLFVLGSQPSEDELWAEQAELAGFGDLYSWVEGEAQ